MLGEPKTSEIDEFLDAVAKLRVDDFVRVRARVLEDYPLRKSARGVTKLGAADFSQLRKRIKTLVTPHLSGHIEGQVGSGGLSLFDAISDVMGAVQAIVKRDKLSVEQYEAFVGGFREAGVTVPDHPSLSEDR
ncbi:MAG: hypothetical protein K4304_08295 [Propionicimonas sp.]